MVFDIKAEEEIAALTKQNQAREAYRRARMAQEIGMLNAAIASKGRTTTLPTVSAGQFSYVKPAAEVARETELEVAKYNRETGLEIEKLRGENSVKAAAAGKSDGGGGGCFITTATIEALGVDNGEDVLDEFRGFRDNWLSNQQDGNDLIARYYEVAPSIVNAIGTMKSVYLLVWEKYLKPCQNLIRNNQNDDALNLYRAMCNKLEGSFL